MPKKQITKLPEVFDHLPQNMKDNLNAAREWENGERTFINIPGIFHLSDSHCTVNPNTLCCDICGVDHSGECPQCHGRGFHKCACPEYKG